MQKAERPIKYFSNTFTYNQAEQIKKGVMCVQILLEIHLIFCDFIQVFVFTTNHHIEVVIYGIYKKLNKITKNNISP